MDVFNRYAPFIQDTIYEHGWQSLRGVQVAAGEAGVGGEIVAEEREDLLLRVLA